MKLHTFVGKGVAGLFTMFLGFLGKLLFPRTKRPKSIVKGKKYKPGYSSGTKYQVKPTTWTPKEK